MSASIRAQKVLVFLTLALAALFFVGFASLMGFFPPPSPSLSTSQVVLLYTEHNLRFRAGVMLSLLSAGFPLPWSVVLYAQMARHEQGLPIWSMFQVIAGGVGTIFLWMPALLWGVAAFSVDRDPALTVLMHEFGWLTFITTVSIFPMQLACVAVVSLSRKKNTEYSAFPRWIGYLSIWLALQSLGGVVAQLFKRGIFAWSGLFPFYMPLTLYGIWTAALAFTLLRALRDQRA